MGKALETEVVQEKALVKHYGEALEVSREQLEKALPPGESIERLIQTCRNAVARNPDLQRCTMASLVQCAMDLAEWGLYTGGALAEAHIVPFNVKVKQPDGRDQYENRATVLPDWKGLLKLAMQHPDVQDVQAHPIYENDEFDYQLGGAPEVTHKPCWKGDPGPLIGAYMVAWLANGLRHIEVMSREQIDAIRRQSKSSDSPAWKHHYPEMSRKVVLKRGVKALPRARLLAQAVERDNEVYGLTDENLAGPRRIGDAEIVTPQLPETGTVNLDDLQPGEPEPKAESDGGYLDSQGLPVSKEELAASFRGDVEPPETEQPPSPAEPQAPGDQEDDEASKIINMREAQTVALCRALGALGCTGAALSPVRWLVRQGTVQNLNGLTAWLRDTPENEALAVERMGPNVYAELRRALGIEVPEPQAPAEAQAPASPEPPEEPEAPTGPPLLTVRLLSPGEQTQSKGWRTVAEVKDPQGSDRIVWEHLDSKELGCGCPKFKATQACAHVEAYKVKAPG